MHSKASFFWNDINFIIEFVETRLYQMFEFLVFFLIFDLFVLTLFFGIISIQDFGVVEYKTRAKQKGNNACTKSQIVFCEECSRLFLPFF